MNQSTNNMNPMLGAFLIPRLTTYIQSLQRTGTDRKVSLKRRFKARRELLEAHDTLRENIKMLVGAELWNQQVGMTVRVKGAKQIGTICGGQAADNDGVLVSMSMGSGMQIYKVNELEIVLPDGIWDFPH